MKDDLVITNLLLRYPWLSPAAIGVLVVVAVVAGRQLLMRPKLAWLLAAVALIPVVLLTLVPIDRELFARCTIQWALPTPGRVELMANMVLFIGPALFAGLASRRPMMILAGLSGLGMAIEVLQALVTGLGRSCDTTDWLSNTIGAAVGVGLAATALVVDRRRR